MDATETLQTLDVMKISFSIIYLIIFLLGCSFFMASYKANEIYFDQPLYKRVKVMQTLELYGKAAYVLLVMLFNLILSQTLPAEVIGKIGQNKFISSHLMTFLVFMGVESAIYILLFNVDSIKLRYLNVFGLSAEFKDTTIEVEESLPDDETMETYRSFEGITNYITFEMKSCAQSVFYYYTTVLNRYDSVYIESFTVIPSDQFKNNYGYLYQIAEPLIDVDIYTFEETEDGRWMLLMRSSVDETLFAILLEFNRYAIINSMKDAKKTEEDYRDNEGFWILKLIRMIDCKYVYLTEAGD